MLQLLCYPKCIDDVILKDNIAVLVSRILFKYLDFFNLSFDRVIEWHITIDNIYLRTQDRKPLFSHLQFTSRRWKPNATITPYEMDAAAAATGPSSEPISLLQKVISSVLNDDVPLCVGSSKAPPVP